MDGGGRVDGQTDETDGQMNGRSTNYNKIFPWRLYIIVYIQLTVEVEV